MEFEKYFTEVEDPRDIRKVSHLLTDIIGLSILGTIVSCESYDDIEEFGREKEEWLRQYLHLPNEIPSHDTLQRTFESITIDAMGCQKEIAEQIVKQGGNYILAVKGNQKELLEEIEAAFQRGGINDTKQTIDKGHGRIEQRVCSTITNLTYIDESIHWSEKATAIRIQSKRTIADKSTEEVRYFISNHKHNADWFLGAIRSHWGIENNLHWVLDMVFNEDSCRKRKENAAENFNLIRKAALNIVKNYKGDKVNLKRRRLKAAWNVNYLDLVLKS